MLDVRDLHFKYKNSSSMVLNGVDLSLQDGETGILLGKNGAGKSTLFANIVGIEKPISGSIILNNMNILNISSRERAKMISYVGQSLSFGALSVFDSVLLGRMPIFGFQPGKSDISATKEIIEKMGLSQLSDRFANKLSGGEKQRVAIARAIAGEPTLVVFDEPTGNLDIQGDALMIGEFKRLSKEKNITLLVSMHDINTALLFGDRFFFMKDGKIAYNIRADELQAQMLEEIFETKVKIIEYENRKIVIGDVTL